MPEPLDALREVPELKRSSWSGYPDVLLGHSNTPCREGGFGCADRLGAVVKMSGRGRTSEAIWPQARLPTTAWTPSGEPGSRSLGAATSVADTDCKPAGQRPGGWHPTRDLARADASVRGDEGSFGAAT